jgi:hypothetical protein
MYEVLHDKGLEILAFPSNQFGDQEPGTNEEIQDFCSGLGVNFPVFAKVSRFLSLFVLRKRLMYLIYFTTTAGREWSRSTPFV